MGEKTETVRLRLSEIKKNEWQKKSILSGRSLSKFIFDSVEKKEIVSSVDIEATEKLRLEISKIGNNINQLARWVNTHKDEADTKEVLTQLEIIEDYLISLINAS